MPTPELITGVRECTLIPSARGLRVERVGSPEGVNSGDYYQNEGGRVWDRNSRSVALVILKH